ncbi:hypothetical protein L484_008720 [Morus notabilis]|uniref:Uncharacterized protein n=2 Tax=Morus notabilis TaxID=981085 RepID=W9RB96_9ROSA|nr:hypothetical protein L484_008720 [Morus notabilis]
MADAGGSGSSSLVAVGVQYYYGGSTPESDLSPTTTNTVDNADRLNLDLSLHL